MRIQSEIERVRAAMATVAKLAAENSEYEPIYEAFERDLAELKSGASVKSKIKRRLEIEALI
ncbi:MULTISPECIES: hypothetical protein [unclassified Rhizobium]|uniref:hypothetical protein n=1 Tax=unclassified Rhizobium TaxID=2613769 RepID=UPI001ADD57BE|nr:MULTISPECIES: hypothetical protein [unclassified Rhizobium]MBO9122503.1 hypothetical protein [Rhizobium sp. 16-488-2b]MBO9173034.1 hypothetical protein [Rhizobium sp. 16-488-2a]